MTLLPLECRLGHVQTVRHRILRPLQMLAGSCWCRTATLHPFQRLALSDQETKARLTSK